MKEFIEKLIGRLEELQNYACFPSDFVSEEQEKVYHYFKAKLTEILKLAESYHIHYEQEYMKGYEDARKNVGWIPCSERLPKAGKRYLVSAIWKDEDFEKHSVYDAVYGTDGIWHTYEYKPIMYEVIAWIPLPQPYKEEGV